MIIGTEKRIPTHLLKHYEIGGVIVFNYNHNWKFIAYESMNNVYVRFDLLITWPNGIFVNYQVSTSCLSIIIMFN